MRKTKISVSLIVKFFIIIIRDLNFEFLRAKVEEHFLIFIILLLGSVTN